ncbi:MAG: P13 family porin [Spirochaetaceae bacterium]|jgi:hypothetical protein|nr:P13 family porin [Spirochaetaceae bacterium]
MRKCLFLMVFVFLGLEAYCEESQLDANYGDVVFYDFLHTPQFDLSSFAYNSGQKAMMAENNKWAAFTLNLLLGFGIGSFVQGDGSGGLAALFGEAGSLALILSSPRTGVVFAYIGLGGFLAMRIFELIRPFSYANKFYVSFVPGFNETGKPVLTSAINFKY